MPSVTRDSVNDTVLIHVTAILATAAFMAVRRMVRECIRLGIGRCAS